MSGVRIRNSVSILLSVLMLISAAGFTMEAHFCGGSIQDFAVFGHAKKCGGNQENGVCEVPATNSGLNKVPCCSDLTVYHTLGAVSLPALHQIVNGSLLFHVYTDSIRELIRCCILTQSARYHPPPDPLKSVRIFLLNDVFLI